jgi:EpsI family protein
MSPQWWRWAPAGVLIVGAAALYGGARPPVVSQPLRAPLAEMIPTAVDGAVGRDYSLPERQQRAAGMSDYVLRVYTPGAGEKPFQVYVAYYDEQTDEKRTHSPMDCLPGAGWTRFVSHKETIGTPQGQVPVRYLLIQQEASQFVVLYWYQGRGRVVSSEYVQKWYILRDKLLKQRSEEALVRVIVPVDGSEAEARRLALRIAAPLLGSVERALPASGTAAPPSGRVAATSVLASPSTSRPSRSHE